MSNSAYAGVVSRIAALAADITLLMVADLAIGSMPRLVWEQLIIRPAPHWLTTCSAMVAAVLPWSYFTACWWLSGQTAGGRLFGIAVQRTDGRALSFPLAAGRAALGLALVPLWIVGYLATLWDERRRAWHDRITGTVVRYVGSR